MTIDDCYRHCRAIAHKHGANFSVGFRFLPRTKRRAVYAAYAFCRVADDIADEVDESSSRRVVEDEVVESSSRPVVEDEVVESTSRPVVEEPLVDSSTRRLDDSLVDSLVDSKTRRLDDWQKELDAAYAGSPTHPITIALADALRHFAIPKSAFVALIDGCRQDMVKTRYETFDELLQYCELVAASISDISLAIFGYRDDAALGHGRSLAIALQLTNVTRDIGDDLGRDRVYVPAEELRRFGVEEWELFARAENDRVKQLIELQIERARGYFEEAEPLLRELDFDARFPTLLMGGIYATVLAKLRQDPLVAIRRRLSLSPLQKLLVVGTRVLRPHFV